MLDFFAGDPQEYAVIFTPNASGALKLVGESYPFTTASRYLVAYDNHNSVNGIREFARADGAQVTYMPTIAPDLRLDARAVRAQLAGADHSAANLFAYPAQSNFSGVQHPLEWVAEAQSLGWDVLLDCAAFTPTNRLRLDEVRPDFVPLSFYKMFGYPTGVGALIAKRLPRLQSSTVPGLPAERSRSPRFRVKAGTTSAQVRPASRTEPSITSACRPSKLACATWSRWIWMPSIPGLCALPAGCSKKWPCCVMTTGRHLFASLVPKPWTGAAAPSPFTCSIPAVKL